MIKLKKVPSLLACTCGKEGTFLFKNLEKLYKK
mgnify:FL=1